MKHLPVCCPRAAIAHAFCVSCDIRARPRLSWSASPAPVRWVLNEVVDLLSSDEIATPHATLQSARMPEHQMSHASTKAIESLRCARDARCRLWVLVVQKRTRAVDPRERLPCPSKKT